MFRFGQGQTPRVRFAPTPPATDGLFVHVGHVSTWLIASREAERRGWRLEVRMDGQPGLRSLLDAVNCAAWFGIPVARWYVLPTITPGQIAEFTSGDMTGVVQSELSSAFDDLIENPYTVIVRGTEFMWPEVVNRMDALDECFADFREAKGFPRKREEINTPLVTRHGAKMMKSSTRDNALHWTALQEFAPGQVRDYLLGKAANNPEQWDWNWREFVEAM